jgi:hypothetical protein
MGTTSLAWRSLGLCFALAFLCLLTYGRGLTLPLISDDYLQIHLGRDYGSWEQWPALAADTLYRCRATSIVLTHWTEKWLGLDPFRYHLTSLLVHFLNCCLVACLGIWRPIGFVLSIPAALVFAFLERPHEAVLWYSALPELLVFAFTLAALLAWIQYCQTGRWRWYVAAGVAFALALLSKESAVVFVPLAVLLAGWRRELWWRLLPAVAASVWYFLSIHGARETHLHFNDGTFSLSAPFWATELRTIGRLLGPWGSVALLVLAAIRRDWRILAACFLWMVVTLLPYSFLTYQGAAPSRHTYLAAVGPAFLLAAAWRTLRDRFPRQQRWLAAVATVCVLHQTAYVWAFKHHQFVERAKPTEHLLAAAREYQGPIQMRCLPFPRKLAELALTVTRTQGVWLVEEYEHAPLKLDFCPNTAKATRADGRVSSGTVSTPAPRPTPERL